MLSFEFRGETLRLSVGHYQRADGPMSVQLIDASGERYATASVNMPDASEQLPPDAFFLKAWSENAEVAQALVESGLLVPLNVVAYSGYVSAEAYTLAAE